MEHTDNKVFKSGAIRNEVNPKPAWSLIPWDALEEVAKVYNEGADRYGAHNWEKGIPYSNIVDHMVEHLSKWMQGDGSEAHMAKVAWGALAIVAYQKWGMNRELDDVHWRPVPPDWFPTEIKNKFRLRERYCGNIVDHDSHVWSLDHSNSFHCDGWKDMGQVE